MKKQKAAGSLVVWALLACACGEQGTGPSPQERILSTLGPLEGLRQDGRTAFLGIPYAEPPTGTRRFRPPRPASSWGVQTREAKAFASACLQKMGDQIVGSEDCLYLNVWTPDTRASLPVMVWIHGGFFVIGSTDIPAYDGGELARRGQVVVVSVQYRLGALGHLAHADLATADYPGGGNFSFLDQALALQWVQREIAGFGGDPGRVTIFGESAGGESVCTAVVSPLTRGLFQRAVIQSQHCGVRSMEVARARGGELVEALGCGGGQVVGCLQALPAETIIEHQVDPSKPGVDVTLLGTSYQPTVDGLVLQDTPRAVIAAGEHNRVPVLSMSLAEDAFFLLNVYTWQFLDEVGILLGIPESDRLDIATHYQTKYSLLNGYPLDYDRGMLATDLILLCPETLQLLLFAQGQDIPVYRLLFDYAPAGYYKMHGMEIPYLFQKLDLPEYAPLVTDTDRWVEKTMLDIWTGFARDGVPPVLATTTGEPWPAFSTTTQSYLALGENQLRIESRLHEIECQMFGLFFP